jgi:hypothetical protein
MQNNFVLILLGILLLYIIYSKTNKSSEDFIPVNALTNYDDMYSTINLMYKVDKFLRKHKMEYWITGGTLLGAIRHGYMIPWDDDADIGMMETDSNKLLLLKDELKNEGLALVEQFFGYKIYSIDGKEIPNKNFKYPFIDIFVSVLDNNMIVNKYEYARNFWVNDKYKYNDLFPLKEYQFEYYKVLGPNNGLPYIDTNYKDWKTRGSRPAFDHVSHMHNKSYDFDLMHTDKPYIWLYNTNNNINNIIDSIKKHNNNKFLLNIINDDNIINFIPELKEYQKILKLIKNKKLIYQIMLLYEYGCIFIDNQYYITHPLDNILEFLLKFDFLIINDIIISRPHTILLGGMLKDLLNKLDTFKTDIDNNIITDNLNKMPKTYKYLKIDNIKYFTKI